AVGEDADVPAAAGEVAAGPVQLGPAEFAMLLELALFVAAGAADEVADEGLRAREQWIAEGGGEDDASRRDAMQLVRELRPRRWRDMFQHVHRAHHVEAARPERQGVAAAADVAA